MTSIRSLLWILFVGASATPAVAQEISSAEPARWDHQHARFDAAGTGFSVVPSASTLALGRVSGGITLHVADRPLVLERGAGDSRAEWASLLQSTIQSDLHLAVGFGPAELGVVLPLAPVAIWGADPTGGSFPTHTNDEGAVGDLVLVPKLRLLDPLKRGFGLAVQVPVSLPTGMSKKFYGSPLPSMAIDVIAELSLPRLRILVALAPVHLQRRIEWTDWTRFYSIDWKAGVGVRLAEKLDLRGELWGSIHPLGDEERATFEAAASVVSYPAEFLALEVGIGGGVGLGVPRFRAMGGIRVMVPGARWREVGHRASDEPTPAAPTPAAPTPAEDAAPPAAPASEPAPATEAPSTPEAAPTTESTPASNGAPAAQGQAAPATDAPAPADGREAGEASPAPSQPAPQGEGTSTTEGGDNSGATPPQP